MYIDRSYSDTEPRVQAIAVKVALVGCIFKVYSIFDVTLISRYQHYVKDFMTALLDMERDRSVEKMKPIAKTSVDMTKPIVAQVGHLGADYDDWVHQPVTRKECPRFFESNLLEMGTKAKWWMIPMIWGPVALLFEAKAVSEGLAPRWVLLVFLAGVLAWTLTEYLLHRFLFHMKTSTYWPITIHYVIHGFHHKHPMDSDRLVFPPLFALGIAVPVWCLLQVLIASPALCSSVFGGLLTGYILYDLTHYFLHFGTAFTDRLYKMKKDHSKHHFQTQMHNFSYGVTSPFWDIVFNTLPPTKLKRREHGPQAVGIQSST